MTNKETEEELWADVTSTDGMYRISSKGNLYSKHIGRNKKLTAGPLGYVFFNTYINKKRKTHSAHREVARAFLKDFREDLQVDHIDGNKANNNLWNLRMLTRSKNCEAFRSPKGGCRSRGVTTMPNGRFRAIFKNRHIGIYETETEAAIKWNQKAKEHNYPESALNSVF